MNFKKGDRVTHVKQKSWGLGQILEDPFGEYLSVFFLNVGKKKIRKEFMEEAAGDSSETFHLDHLTFDSEKPVPYHSIPELKSWFYSIFLQGFYDEQYLEREREYKVAAHEFLHEVLNKETFGSLIAAEKFDEISSRCLKILNKTNLVFPNEKMALKDGLKSEDNQKQFSNSLFDLLFNSTLLESNFVTFSGVLQHIGAAKWTIATYFLFLCDPNNYMFVKPTVTRKVANSCAFELNYRPELNWLTYSSVLNFAKFLNDGLADMKPRDFIDIQSFIWCAERISDGSYSKRE